MAEPHVVSVLVAKHSEMAGLIQHHKAEIQRLAADLSHLDATIKLFAPEFDLRTVRAKEHRTRNSFFRPGECPRLVLDILRESCQAMTCRHLVDAMRQTKGLKLEDAELHAVQKVLNGVLRRMEKNGTVREAGRDSLSHAYLWELAYRA